MAAVVAHEVKNPLAGVQGVLQILRTRPVLDARDKAIIGDVLKRLENLNYLLTDVLSYARPPQMTPGPVPIVAFLKDVTSTLSQGEDFARVTIQVVHEPDEVVLSGDSRLLERVFINLLVNGAHAVGGDGAVTITVREAGDQCEIAVRDNGPGFPEGVAGKIFDPFFTTKSRGTGLGLAICKQAVELHGGTITAASDARGGAVVTVTLPMEAGG
jgi:signal transduction histidine kinase